METEVINNIAFCQGLIDYWQGECKNMSIDYLDLDNDLDKINNVLQDVLHLLSKKGKRS